MFVIYYIILHYSLTQSLPLPPSSPPLSSLPCSLQIDGTMNGEPYQVGKFSHSLRVHLFK